MAYLTPTTGFECPVAALRAMGITPIAGDLNITRAIRRRNRKNLGGRRSLRIDSSDSVMFAMPNITNVTHFHIGFRMSAHLNRTSFQFRINGATNATIVISNLAKIEIRRGGSTGVLLATSVATLSDNTWHLLEFEVLARNIGRIRVWVDGDVTEFVDSGVEDCQQISSTDDFDAMIVEVGAGCSVWLDDLLIADNVTGRATKPWFAVGLGAGNPGSTQFTPVSDPANWQNVDEKPENFNSAQFNTSTTAGHIDRYLLKNPPFEPADVLFLQSVAVVAREGNIVHALHTIDSNGTVASGANMLMSGGGSTTVVVDQFFVDPDTATTWARRGLSTVKAGVQINT